MDSPSFTLLFGEFPRVGLEWFLSRKTLHRQVADNRNGHLPFAPKIFSFPAFPLLPGNMTNFGGVGDVISLLPSKFGFRPHSDKPYFPILEPL